MNINANSRFSLAPSVNIPRTRMNRPFNNSLTFDCGELVPFYISEVIPGSTHKVITHKVVRTQPLVSAPMQDIFLDTYYFFIPFRLVWTHFREFMGENTSSAWVPQVTYTIPQVRASNAGPSGVSDLTPYKGTLWDYFGMPLPSTLNGNIDMNALYFRAYALIVREFFQSEAVETPINVPLDDTLRPLVPIAYINDEQYICQGAKPYIVNKFHDYFTTVLPTPTKGTTDVLAFPKTPVVALDDHTGYTTLQKITGKQVVPAIDFGTQNSSGTQLTSQKSINTSAASGGNVTTLGNTNSSGSFPLNLWTGLDVSIDQLRTAFAIQRLLQRDALGGTRYREMLRAHFGVISPDASMQVPQYLGGSRKALRISQIVQTSETDQTPLGNIAGMSLTNDSHYEFESSFTEHGIILGLMCTRYKHRYSQGVHRRYSRKTRYDFYSPEFAFLGSQAILKKEIFADGSSSDDSVLGYGEYWSDYKFNPDMVVGEFRPNLNIGLKSWTFADNYTTHPTLSRNWLKEDKTNLDRCLAVTSSVSNQFFANVEVQETVTLPMPLYSYPSIMSQF